jgi:hypothetical protein
MLLMVILYFKIMQIIFSITSHVESFTVGTIFYFGNETEKIEHTLLCFFLHFINLR